MASEVRNVNLTDPVMKHALCAFRAVANTQTVGDALTALREQPPTSQFFYIYVVDAEGRLVGVVPTRALLGSEPETPLASLMIREVVVVPATATVLEACEFFIQYRFLALPVVDPGRKLVGIVDVGLFTDEVFELAEKRAHDDIFQVIGIHVRRNQQLAPWTGFRDRFPWLIANIIGGTICALLSGAYSGLLNAVIAVAMFVPIVLTLSESVSIQSMSILLQGLHGSRIDWRFLMRALAREFGVACLLGIVSGTLVGLVASLWLGSIRMGVSVGISIAVALLFAGLLGLVLPIAIRALRADPRIASGPIVLATTDVVTLLCYLAISASILLP